MYLLENATGSALTSLVKQSLSQEGIALLPCSKALLMFPMVPPLRNTWQSPCAMEKRIAATVENCWSLGPCFGGGFFIAQTSVLRRAPAFHQNCSNG